MDTISNCQRLAFTHGVSQHMHKITNLWKFELNRSSKLRDNNERKKHHCHTKFCAFRWLISRPQIPNLRSQNQIRGKLVLLSKNYGTSEGAVSHNVLYHQPLPNPNRPNPSENEHTIPNPSESLCVYDLV